LKGEWAKGEWAKVEWAKGEWAKGEWALWLKFKFKIFCSCSEVSVALSKITADF
jgi:hypothetical protein